MPRRLGFDLDFFFLESVANVDPWPETAAGPTASHPTLQDSMPAPQYFPGTAQACPQRGRGRVTVLQTEVNPPLTPIAAPPPAVKPAATWQRPESMSRPLAGQSDNDDGSDNDQSNDDVQPGTKRRASMPAARGGRKPAVDSDFRPKKSNKDAAGRYRLKKKIEFDEMQRELQVLRTENSTLLTKVNRAATCSRRITLRAGQHADVRSAPRQHAAGSLCGRHQHSRRQHIQRRRHAQRTGPQRAHADCGAARGRQSHIASDVARHGAAADPGCRAGTSHTQLHRTRNTRLRRAGDADGAALDTAVPATP